MLWRKRLLEGADLLFPEKVLDPFSSPKIVLVFGLARPVFQSFPGERRMSRELDVVQVSWFIILENFQPEVNLARVCGNRLPRLLEKERPFGNTELIVKARLPAGGVDAHG